jgi:hypothetical protein
VTSVRALYEDHAGYVSDKWSAYLDVSYAGNWVMTE